MSSFENEFAAEIRNFKFDQLMHLVLRLSVLFQRTILAGFLIKKYHHHGDDGKGGGLAQIEIVH